MASTSKSSGMKALVEQFCAITGSTEEIGQRMLEACDGNLEMAINMHVDGSGAEITNSLSASSSNNPPELTNINVPTTIPLQPDEESVRAPIPQTRGVLVEESYHFGLRGRRRTGRSVFDGFRDFQQEARQQEAQLFNLLPENHSKRKTLEDLFRPPIDLMHKGSFETARDAGQVVNKWLLVNVQNAQEFSCQALNRDVWSNAAVKSILQEHFVFWQVYHDSEEGKRYMQFYKVVDFPYIAILDPRTGENMLIWHKVDALSFCELVTGFLTEHPSLDVSVGCSPPKKIQRTDSIVDASEELQLEAAIAASLAETKHHLVRPLVNDSDDDSYQSDSDTESSLSPQQDKNIVEDIKCKNTLNNSDANIVEVEDKNQSSSSNSNDSTTSDTVDWKTYLGQDDGVTSNLMIRFPDGAKKQLTLPASSKLMAVVTYVISKGFGSDKYELITTFPRRKVSTLDPDMTLKEAGLFPQETVFVQERGSKMAPDLRPFLYGGLASITAEFGTFPIDTTKTRLQIQGQKIDSKYSELKYKGMSHALMRISQEEGIKALYSGIGPAVLRQATYGTIKIGIYHKLKRFVAKDPRDETLLKNILCGAIAGTISASIANPTDVLKIRMQAQNSNFMQKSMLQSFVTIYQQEGTSGLWRGVAPTAQRAAVIAGVELAVYDMAKKRIIFSGLMGDNISTHFVASFVAGLAGAIASNPIDVVKTRLMNQRKLKAVVLDGAKTTETIYASSMDCVLQTVKTEGFLALYKGFIPTWVRLGPWNIIFFITYEQLKHIY